MYDYIYRWRCSSCAVNNETPSTRCKAVCRSCQKVHAYACSKCGTCNERIDCLALPKIIYICFGYYYQRQAWEVGPGTYIPEFVNCDEAYGGPWPYWGDDYWEDGSQ